MPEYLAFSPSNFSPSLINKFNAQGTDIQLYNNYDTWNISVGAYSTFLILMIKQISCESGLQESVSIWKFMQYSSLIDNLKND